MSKFHTLGKADAARQEKNAWRLRANVAENRLRQIRNVLRDDSIDGEQVSAIRDAIAAWENECPNVPPEMAPVKRLECRENAPRDRVVKRTISGERKR